MSDDDAFLNAIREQPEDVVRRLVYADLLQERGDERHEMIRLETRMREIPIWSDEFQQLKPERKRLREKLPHEWLVTMDYLPKHRPMFGTIPPTFEERWRLAEEFIDIWHGGLKPGDGYSEEEIVATEKRLGSPLPFTLRELYRRAGRRKQLWATGAFAFFELSELVWKKDHSGRFNDHLVFHRYLGGQDQFYLQRTLSTGPDPTVFGTKARRIYANSVSEYMLRLLVLAAPSSVSCQVNPAASYWWAKHELQPPQFYQSYQFGKDGTFTHIWEGSDFILRGFPRHDRILIQDVIVRSDGAYLQLDACHPGRFRRLPPSHAG